MYWSINTNLPPIKGYISEAVQDRRLIVLITNRKSHMTFRLVQKLVTLNNLEWRNGQTTVKIWRFFIFKMAAAAILDFHILKILTSERSIWPNCVNMPNFVQIGQTASEIWLFFDFYAAMLDFQIFVNFNNWNAQEGQTASSCQISSKSVTCQTVKIALNLS